jgi:hypothetical protein
MEMRDGHKQTEILAVETMEAMGGRVLMKAKRF